MLKPEAVDLLVLFPPYVVKAKSKPEDDNPAFLGKNQLLELLGARERQVRFI